MANPIPKYTLWEAINTAITLGMRALDEIRTLARTPGPKGDPGLGFEDMECVQTDERTMEFRLSRGKDMVCVGKMHVPAMIYRGVFGSAPSYGRGDVVTWGGSAWVALKDTSAKPEHSSDWQLAVKRGRDGKDTVSLPPAPDKPVKL